MYNIQWEIRNIYVKTEGNEFVRKPFVWLLVLACLLVPSFSLADESGVLAETELSQWVDQVLRDTAALTPLNAPVGEESLTEDGYAFLYDFATLYYNKPQLDGESILQAVSITSEGYASPRNLSIGSTEEELLAAYGWQNPYLMGDGSFAAFYLLDELPRAAYWSWGQLDAAGALQGVRCAMHVKAGEDRYTDAGVRFALEDGRITEIRVYGLYSYMTLADVQANLSAVESVENALGRWALAEEDADGYTVQNAQAMFEEGDLSFANVDFRTLAIDQLEALIGERAKTQTLDAGDEQMVTAEWDGAYLSGAAAGGVDVLSVTDRAIEGPRGLRVGDALDKVLSSFFSDGEGRIFGSQALLYGDGQNAPFGVLEKDGDLAIVSYTAQMQRAGDLINVTLMLQFADDLLEEWMIYTW